MAVFRLDPEVYKRYKDEVLKLCNSFQKIDQPGLSDKQIAERLGLDERTVTEIRCVAERDCYSLDEWEKAIEFKRKATLEWSALALDRPPALASELVGLGLEMIIAVGDPAIRAARDATTTIPIVMGFGSSDPVKSGFVASLARPGGNVTGLTALASDLNAKRLDLLKQALPDTRRIALLSRSDPSLSEQVTALRAI